MTDTPRPDFVGLLVAGEAIRGDYQKMWIQAQIDLSQVQATLKRRDTLLADLQVMLERYDPDIELLKMLCRIEEEIGPLDGREVSVDDDDS